ncbi:MAG: hypothetical protein RLZZ500_1271 [Bacteroidota bacterium]|jgi:hypothetical protein
MELKLALGIDNIKFGLIQDEVFSLLGNPNKIHIDEDDENEIVCDWNDYKFRLTFYKDENLKLGYIRIKNQNLTFKNQKIIGQSLRQVKEIVFAHLNNWELDEYEFFSTYFNEKFWLTLHVDYGIIEEVEIGVPFKNNFEYDWPE